MFQDMIFRAYQFLVLSLFVHVFPLLIGLACIDSQDLIFKSLVISNIVCALLFFKSRTLMFQDMIFRAYLFLVLSLFVHVFPLLNGLACIVSQHLIFMSLVIPNVVCALIFKSRTLIFQDMMGMSMFLFCLCSVTSFHC